MSTASRLLTLAEAVGSDVRSLLPVLSQSNKNTLLRYRAKRAGAQIGAGLCRVAILGDSTTAGYPNNIGLASWPMRARAMMVAAGYPTAGQGWIPTINGPNNTRDPRWTFSANWAAADTYTAQGTLAYPMSVTFVSGSTATYTSTETGTVASVLYLNNSGPFSVQIDSAAAVTVTPPMTGPGVNPTPYTVSGLANTVHTIKITSLNTAGAYVVAAEVRKTSGILIDNWGYTSSWAKWFIEPMPYDYGSIIAASNPDLVVLGWGLNEISSGDTAGFKAALLNVAAKFPNKDLVIATGIPVDAAPGGSTAQQLPFRQAQLDVAKQLNARVFDFYTQWGGNAVFQRSLGMVQDDLTHPSTIGYADMGIRFSSLLLE
jgi:hypothetical protein